MQKLYSFENPEDYDYDSEFVDISNGTAKLKIGQSEDGYIQSFTSDTGFVYDSSLAEFTGGVLRQKDKRPSGATFGASYSSSINGSWASSGSLTGTANNSASVSGGRLNLTGGGSKSVDYNISGKLGIQSGCIRLKWTPNYNGTPTDSQTFFTIEETQGDGKSKIELLHHSNGSLFLLVNDTDGSNIYSNSLLTFMATAGSESVIEVGWDLSAGGKFYVFGNGFLLAELDGTFTRSDCAFLRIGGSGGPTDSFMDDLIIFSSNQHTATHDPTYSVPDAAFVASTAILPEMAYNSGDGSFLEVTDFSDASTNDPQYTIQIGQSGDYLYWNGSAWIESDGTYSQSNDADTISDNVSSLDVNGELYAQVKVHFQTSNTQQSVNTLTLTILESTTYTTDDQRITPNGRFQAIELISMVDSVATPEDTFVRYILEIDSIKKYWNGSAWVRSNGNFDQSNTQQQIEDNIVSLIDDNVYVKLLLILKTDNSSATPVITSAAITFEEDMNGLRGYLNSILAFIGAESLTDEEFESLPEDLEQTDDLAVYQALLGVLEARENVSSSIDRLNHYFLAMGTAVGEPETAVSNIFVGSSL